MAAKAGTFDEDGDWLYLETTISHAKGIEYAAEKIWDKIDDPEVLRQVRIIVASANYIQDLHRDYRPRIAELKLIEQGQKKTARSKERELNYVTGNAK